MKTGTHWFHVREFEVASFNIVMRGFQLSLERRKSSLSYAWDVVEVRAGILFTPLAIARLVFRDSSVRFNGVQDAAKLQQKRPRPSHEGRGLFIIY